MKKPGFLRQTLIKKVSYLHAYPGTLSMSAEKGVVKATTTKSLSFEYNYVLNLTISYYTGDLNFLIVPLLQWIGKNQPDLIANPELRKTGFTFAVDTFSQDATNIKIGLKLTERVLVREDGENLTVEDLQNPKPHFNRSQYLTCPRGLRGRFHYKHFLMCTYQIVLIMNI